MVPIDYCWIPYVCRRLGLCSNGANSYHPQCSCPCNFHSSSQSTSNCSLTDGSCSLPLSCNSTKNNSSYNYLTVSYLSLGHGVDYFANDFTMRSKDGVNLSVCQYLYSGDCACFGVFYENSSGSCYVLKNEVGSIMLRAVPEV